MNQLDIAPAEWSAQYADMPGSPRERQKWFMDNYRGLVRSHVANLRTFFWNFPKQEQAIVFNSIMDDWRIQIMYGKFLIILPNEETQKASEWSTNYVVFIDNTEVWLVSRIESAQTITRWRTNDKLSPIDKLLPPILSRNSQNVIISRKIDVRKR